uniref:Uncharacterized protein n=1 Tax=Laticauda laticaudata TaxID=8630 RepID=A0A8C5S1E1_LATLA
MQVSAFPLDGSWAASAASSPRPAMLHKSILLLVLQISLSPPGQRLLLPQVPAGSALYPGLVGKSAREPADGWRRVSGSLGLLPRDFPLPPRLLPCLVVLALMVLRSSGPLSSEALLQPLPQAGHDSPGAPNLSCSSCLILIHLSHNSCYKTPRQPGPLLSPQHLGKESSIFFLAFVVVVVSACVVLYCRVKRWQCRDCHGLRSEGGLVGRSCVSRSFQLVLVLCWMPACLLVVLSFTGLQLSTLFPLLVATVSLGGGGGGERRGTSSGRDTRRGIMASFSAQALTAPLQGFLHSLVYGWLRGSFRQEVAGERLPLYCSPDLKATFDDSLAASGYPWKPSTVHK